MHDVGAKRCCGHDFVRQASSTATAGAGVRSCAATYKHTDSAVPPTMLVLLPLLLFNISKYKYSNNMYYNNKSKL